MYLSWRKSSYSTGNGGECVEVGTTIGAAVAVRDTKDRDAKGNSAGLVLRFTPRAWARFTTTLK